MSASKTAQYVLFDAKDKILGRLATEIARTLSGKDAVDYQPHLGGDKIVIVINAGQVRLSANKARKKVYWKHSGYPGGITSITFADLIKKNPSKVIELAVKGMLPKNKLSRQALKRLKIFRNEEHPYRRYLESNSQEKADKK